MGRDKWSWLEGEKQRIQNVQESFILLSFFHFILGIKMWTEWTFDTIDTEYVYCFSASECLFSLSHSMESTMDV